MLPYSQRLVLDNARNYGIVKTETLFGFDPHRNDYNTSDALGWIFTPGNFERRSMRVDSKLQNTIETPPTNSRYKDESNQKKTKKLKRQSKTKKCVFKVFKKSDRKNRRRNKYKMQRKYMMPMLLGMLAAKSLLIPIALKALAFLSTKGLMLGFLSTVMASILSLKGIFDNSHRYQDRKDDTKTQVEIVQVPSKSEDHVYYDDHYRRGDLVPIYEKLSELNH